MLLRSFKSGKDNRRLMFRKMIYSIFNYGHLRTTLARGKSLKRVFDRVITYAKRSNRNLIKRKLGPNRQLIDKVVDYSSRMKDRSGGYLSSSRQQNRRGDSSSIMMLKLIA